MCKYSHLILILLLSAVLGGCASTSIQNANLDSNQSLPLNHGLVSVQVVNNTERLESLHAGWTEVIAVRIDNAEAIKAAAIEAAKAEAQLKKRKYDESKVDWNLEAHSMFVLSEGSINSQLFAGSMPKGEYVISILHSYFNNGEISSWITMPVRQAAGTFEVAAGRFTNLGSLVFQPLLNVKEKSFWSNSSSSKAYVTRMSEPDALADFVVKRYPTASATVDFNTPLTWKSDDFDSVREQLSVLSRTNAYGSIAAPLVKSGSGAVLAKFGQVRIVDDMGQWQQIDLPTNAQLGAIIEHDDAIWIAGERGQMFSSSSIDGEWILSTPLPSSEAIIWFGKTDTQIFAASRSAKAITLYELDSSGTNWSQVGQFNRKDPNDWLIQNGGVFFIITKNNTLRVLNDNKVYDLNPDKTWTNKRAKSLRKMRQLNDGTLLGLEVSQWDGIGDQVVSFDDGDNWIDIERSLSIFSDGKADASLPNLLNKTTLVTVGRNKSKGKGLFLVTNEIDESGKVASAQVHGQAKATCLLPLPELSRGNRLYYLCDNGSIVSTADLAKTWQDEITIDIAQMQASYETLIDALNESSKD